MKDKVSPCIDFLKVNFRCISFLVGYALYIVIARNTFATNVQPGTSYYYLFLLFEIFFPVLFYYSLLIKPNNISNIKNIAISLFIVKLTLFLLPGINLPDISVTIFFALFELSVVVIFIIRFKLILNNYKKFRVNDCRETAIKNSLDTVLGERISSLIVTEFNVLRHSLFGWTINSDIRDGDIIVTTHKESSQISLLVTIIIVAVIESVVVHLVLNRWNTTVAFWVTAVSLYSILFIIADLVASYKRPSYFVKSNLYLRIGLRWTGNINLSNISSVENINEKIPKEKGSLNGMLLISPNVVLNLKEPILIKGPYGIKKEVNRVSLFVDKRKEIIKIIEESVNEIHF